MILLGAHGQDAVPGDPTPARCGVLGVPHSQHASKVVTRGLHGYTGGKPVQRGQRCGKGGGTGVGTMAGGKGSSTDGHDDGLTRPESGSSCELRSGFPRIRTQPQTGSSIGLPTVA